MSVDLLTPILDNGIRNIHFFHGRILTAQDLRDEQEANRAHHWQLGRALGAGVVEGLEVTVDDDGSGDGTPVLALAAGLAINALGQTLELPQDEKVALARSPDEVPAGAGLFGICLPPGTSQVPTGVGIYLLVLSPASGYREQAPKSGLAAASGGGSCGSRYEVEGVSLRLEQLKPTELAGVSDATRELLANELLVETSEAAVSKLRNVVAHLAFGTEELVHLAADPFPGAPGTSPYLAYGALDELRAQGGLGDCDVPLALVYWTLDGVRFLDLWSVRRRPYELPPSPPWAAVGGARRLAEAEAMLFQFQAQLAEVIAAHPDPKTLAAADYFRYLPPAGLLPVAYGAGGDLDFAAFLAPLPYRETEYYGHPEYAGYPEMLDGARLYDLLAGARLYPPIDLEQAEMVWLYQPVSPAPGSDEARVRAPYMVFANGHLRPRAIARFDVARWDFSNFARGGAEAP